MPNYSTKMMLDRETMPVADDTYEYTNRNTGNKYLIKLYQGNCVINLSSEFPVEVKDADEAERKVNAFNCDPRALGVVFLIREEDGSFKLGYRAPLWIGHKMSHKDLLQITDHMNDLAAKLAADISGEG
ncbi:MAG: hypothetical protein K5911_05000 [Eubacteriales bacterium]|nr:hypothetical protein [Eubacteriales bacterium]